MKAEDTRFFSKKKGELAKGCQYCVKGQKLVLFVTGLCGRECFFCPLSPQKMKKDVIFANERPVYSDQDIIDEARSMDAKGAGITGGDPLLVLDRTLHYIRLLKKEFGKHFHIHLYAPLLLVTKERLNDLNEAGLDEIRFHPDPDKALEWDRIRIALDMPWDVGVEIPVIPGKDLKDLMQAIKEVRFLNLNELEISDANLTLFAELGYHPKEEYSYAVLGSEEIALGIIEDSPVENIHYCTTRLKDKVQLSKRIERMGHLNARPYDKITSQGLLIRGAIYPPGLEPGRDYKERISQSGDDTLDWLPRRMQEIRDKYRIKEIEVDERKRRILLRCSDLKRIAGKIPERCAIVEEYPTWDRLEVETEFLN